MKSNTILILKKTAFVLDWDARDTDGVFIHPVNQQQWESGIIETLDLLSRQPPCQSSQAVIEEFNITGKKVTFIPFMLSSRQIARFGSPENGTNAGAMPVNIPAATAKGKFPDELPQSVINQIGAIPPGPARDRLVESYMGTGAGSDSLVYFNAQDFARASRAVGLDAADEALLHELVHSLRQTKGLEDPMHLLAPFPVLRGGEKDASGAPIHPNRLSQVYGTLEEFAAIVITNIYRSENGRIGLRQHHLAGPNGYDTSLSTPLTNPRVFLTVWRPQLEQLQKELPRVCDQIAPIDCPFNPLFELYAAQNRFAPGGREVLPKPWADPR